MISNTKKRSKMKTILRKLSLNPKSDEAALALHRLLIEDCEGRLYKYMPIKEYTIPSLESRTLHISSPAVFNDPFDCKIGIDIQSLIEAIIPTEQMEIYFKDFLSVNCGKVSIESISDERKPVITRWINNRRLTELINNNQGNNLSSNEVSALLLNNFDLIYEIFFPLLEAIASQKGMPISSDMFQTLLANLNENEKRQLVENNGNYSNFIRSLGVVEDTDEIGLTEKALEKIDPQDTEAFLKFKDAFEKLEQNLNTKLCLLFKVCCLCTDYKNKLMWSHYADSHKGICVEYDFSELKGNGTHPFPVCYSKNRLKVPWKEAIIQSTETQSKIVAHFMEALLTKDKAWEYEREWRFLVPVNECADNIAAPPIKCIYLGALCSEKNSKQIAELAKKLRVPIKRMTVDRGEFELHETSI